MERGISQDRHAEGQAGGSTDAPGGLGAVLRNGGFLKLWCGQVVSTLGDRFTQMALVGLVMGRADTDILTARIFFWFFLPFLFGPLLGPFIDRADKKRILIFAALGQTVAVLPILLFLPVAPDAVADHLHYAFPSLFLLGGLTCLFTTTKTAVLPDLVTRGTLMPANALLAASGIISTAVGSKLASDSIERLGTHGAGFRFAVTFDACTYIVAALAIFAITFPPGRKREIRGFRQVTHDIASGFRYLVAHAEVVKICLFSFVFWGCATAIQTVTPKYVGDVLGKDITEVGSMLAAAGFGLLLGAYLTARFGALIRRRPAYLLSILGLAICLLVLGSTGSENTASLAMFLGGVAGGGLIARIDADILRAIDPEVRGRVMAAKGIVFALAVILPMRPAGQLSFAYGPQAVFLAAGAILAVLSGLMLVLVVADRLRGLPYLETET